MKIHLMSDLHLEFYDNVEDYPYFLLPDKYLTDTTLILAGDIGVGTSAVRWIKAIATKYKYVVYVAGNHEFYRNEIFKTIQNLHESFEDCDNVFFLEKDCIVLENTLIFGGTFWTPGGDYCQNMSVLENMSDFRLIKRLHPDKGYPVRIYPLDLKDVFLKTINSLKDSIEKHKDLVNNIVVVSHHAPSEKSSLEMYKGSNLNPFFYFDAEEYIPFLEDVDLWLHGHMHNVSDYMIGNTRVVANPYGYKDTHEVYDFRDDLILDLDA